MDDFNMDSDINVGSMTIRSILSNKDLLSHPMKATYMDKDDKDFNDAYPDASAAFLGPNIWEKSMTEFKMDYLDLDSLLNEVPQKTDCIDINNAKAHQHQEGQDQHQHHHHHHQNNHHVPNDNTNNIIPVGQSSKRLQQSSPDSSLSEMPKDAEKEVLPVECKFSPTDLALATPPGEEHYDPASTVFPEEELKPQPIIKKSRKNFVPESLKDDKYWARRHKNNIAAKRSRDARRVKENQIFLRASYLERENNSLKEDNIRLKAENDMLKNELLKFQS